MNKLFVIFLMLLLGSSAQTGAVKKNSLTIIDGISKTTMRLVGNIDGYGQKVFLFDPAASYTVIPSNAVTKLVESGHMLETNEIRVIVNGKGGEHTVKGYLLRSLTIGSCTLNHVKVMDVSDDSGFVLGARAIRRMAPVTIDPPFLSFGTCPSLNLY